MMIQFLLNSVILFGIIFIWLVIARLTINVIDEIKRRRR